MKMRGRNQKITPWGKLLGQVWLAVENIVEIMVVGCPDMRRDRVVFDSRPAGARIEIDIDDGFRQIFRTKIPEILLVLEKEISISVKGTLSDALDPESAETPTYDVAVPTTVFLRPVRLKPVVADVVNAVVMHFESAVLPGFPGILNSAPVIVNIIVVNPMPAGSPEHVYADPVIKTPGFMRLPDIP